MSLMINKTNHKKVVTIEIFDYLYSFQNPINKL